MTTAAAWLCRKMTCGVDGVRGSARAGGLTAFIPSVEWAGAEGDYVCPSQASGAPLLGVGYINVVRSLSAPPSRAHPTRRLILGRRVALQRGDELSVGEGGGGKYNDGEAGDHANLGACANAMCAVVPVLALVVMIGMPSKQSDVGYVRKYARVCTSMKGYPRMSSRWAMAAGPLSKVRGPSAHADATPRPRVEDDARALDEEDITRCTRTYGTVGRMVHPPSRARMYSQKTWMIRHQRLVMDDDALNRRIGSITMR